VAGPTVTLDKRPLTKPASIGEECRATIKAYAGAHNAGRGMIQNETAKKLLAEAFAVEEQELKVKRA
jgi:hypothetical protein